jgi:hypothetical protein
VDLRGLATVAGARLGRVVRRPHEIRAYLERDDGGVALWLHFWPADAATFRARQDGPPAIELTEEPVEGGTRVRLRGSDEVIFEAEAPHMSWHPLDGDDVLAWQLDPAERAAVGEAVRATVDRDLGAVRAMGADESLWTWADEQFGESGGWFARPYGPFGDWELAGMRMEGGTEITVELFDTAGQATDLTLRMTLSRDASGAVTVRLEDLHAL